MTSSSSSSPEFADATTVQQDRFSYKHATHDEVLEDLSSRFILNLPDEELASLERICFQVEQAHWFYEDFIREENPKFPSLPLKKFSAMLFHACPLLHQWSHDHEQAFNTFMQYKTRVPVCGAIMLNDTWEKCVLVKGWKASSGWGFPKGKINEVEPPSSCAIREVLEETGYNLAGQIDPEAVIEMSIREQKISLFIVPNVPEDYPFKTKTRKEISKIEWFKLTDLPTWKRNKAAPGKFYLISPFIGALKAFINERKPRGGLRKAIKAKKLPVTQNPQKPNGRIDESSLESDPAQESSSQSSSAENCDPHTPSPQYTQSVPFVADAQVLDVEAIDPHFARLLSSLTMSATNAVQNKDVEKPPLAALTIKPHDPVTRESGTPMPVTASSSSSRPLSDSVDRGDWSASAPRSLSDRRLEPVVSLSSSSQAHSPPLNGLSSPSAFSRSPLTIPTTRMVHPQINTPPISGGLSTESQRRGKPQHSASLSSESSALSPQSPHPRSAASRRSSSTADISPYLTKPIEVPTSARRLQQLALLESIADEAARMTPFLVNQDALSGRKNNLGNQQTYAPPLIPSYIPPASFQIPTTVNDPNDLRVIYSSGPGAAQVNSAPMPLPGHNALPRPTSVHDDPFQVRPQATYAYQRGPAYPPPADNMSMNQAQLLALMNGARATPVQNNPIYPPAWHMQGHRTSYYPPPSVSIGPTHPSLAQHSLPLCPPPPFSPHILPPLQQIPQPLPTSALPSGFGFPQTQSNIANNSQLLSILNGASSATPNSLPYR